MFVRQYQLTDSRGAAWAVTVSGPTWSGTVPPEVNILDLPEQWVARYQRPGRAVEAQEIAVVLYWPDVDEGELLATLEREPAWRHADWARA